MAVKLGQRSWRKWRLIWGLPYQAGWRICQVQASYSIFYKAVEESINWAKKESKAAITRGLRTDDNKVKDCLSHIVPGLLKRLNPFDYFILTLQISITCFGWRPDHMVFDSQLTKIYKDHKKLDPTFTFSQRLWQKVKAGKKWVLNFNPSGVWLCPTFPLLLCPRTPPCWK